MVSKRHTQSKSDKYSGNIHKRNIKGNAKDKKYPFAVGPVVLAFFLFVVLGSCKSERERA